MKIRYYLSFSRRSRNCFKYDKVYLIFSRRRFLTYYNKIEILLYLRIRQIMTFIEIMTVF